jgi:hypothetical protein
VKQFARAFDCYAIRVNAAVAKGFEEPKSRGRHFAFDDDSEEGILSWIEDRAEKSRPVTQKDILHYSEMKYSLAVTQRWVHSCVLRQRDCLSGSKTTPQERARLEVSGVFLDETISCLREFVQGMKAEQVFNLDEVYMSDWEDRKDKKVVVPTALDGQTIHHRVSRNVRHI